MTNSPVEGKGSFFKKGGVLDSVFSDHFDVSNATSFFERTTSEQSLFVEDTLENMSDISFNVLKSLNFHTQQKSKQNIEIH
jgi:hypothetical protein